MIKVLEDYGFLSPHILEKEEEIITGYQVTNMVVAKIRDIEKVGTIIDAVVKAGGDLVRIDSIDFSVDDPSVYYEEAREKAMADAKAREIRFKGKSLELTAAEYDILGMLLQHKNGSVSREQLLYESEHIDDDSSIKNIDVIISRIRQKIAKIDPDNIYIKPIRGVGYLLTDRINK